MRVVLRFKPVMSLCPQTYWSHPSKFLVFLSPFSFPVSSFPPLLFSLRSAPFPEIQPGRARSAVNFSQEVSWIWGEATANSAFAAGNAVQNFQTFCRSFVKVKAVEDPYDRNFVRVWITGTSRDRRLCFKDIAHLLVD